MLTKNRSVAFLSFLVGTFSTMHCGSSSNYSGQSGKRPAMNTDLTIKKKKPKSNPRTMAPLDSALNLEDQRIWKTLATSGFIASPDLGRLLLLTSKNMASQNDVDDSVGTVNNVDESDGSEDTMWKLLCWNHFGVDATNDMLQNTKFSSEVCFRTFAFPSREDHGASLLPVLQYAPKDYVMIVTARKPNGELLFCQSIPGEELGSFFSTGEMEFELKQPIEKFASLSKSHCSLDDFYDSFENLDTIMIDDIWSNGVSWGSKVQLLRCTDNKLITLLDRKYCSEELNWSTTQGRRSRGKLDLDMSTTSGYSVAGSPGLHPVFEHLRSRDYNIYEDGCFELDCGMDFRVNIGRGKPNQTTIGVHGFYIEAMMWDGGFGEPLERVLTKKNMQFAHILEALPEWLEAPVVPRS